MENNTTGRDKNPVQFAKEIGELAGLTRDMAGVLINMGMDDRKAIMQVSVLSEKNETAQISFFDPLNAELFRRFQYYPKKILGKSSTKLGSSLMKIMDERVIFFGHDGLVVTRYIIRKVFKRLAKTVSKRNERLIVGIKIACIEAGLHDAKVLLRAIKRRDNDTHVYIINVRLKVKKSWGSKERSFNQAFDPNSKKEVIVKDVISHIQRELSKKTE